MTKRETAVIAICMGGACLVLCFVGFWWAAVAVGPFLPKLPEAVVAAAAAAGLGVGIVLNAIYLRRWVEQVYTAEAWRLILVYVGLAVVATGFCMGVPLGTFALGIGVGVYMGRRQHHAETDRHGAMRAITASAVLAAIVTTAAAAPIGVMALQEESVVRLIEPILAIGRPVFGEAAGPVFIGILCAVLFVAQYAATRVAGHWAWGRRDRTAAG